MEITIERLNKLSQENQKKQLQAIMSDIQLASARQIIIIQRNVLPKYKSSSIGYQQIWQALIVRKLQLPGSRQISKERYKFLQTEEGAYQKYLYLFLISILSVLGVIAIMFTIGKNTTQIAINYIPQPNNTLTRQSYQNGTISSINVKEHSQSLPPAATIASSVLLLFICFVFLFFFVNCCGWKGWVVRRLVQIRAQKDFIQIYLCQ